MLSHFCDKNVAGRTTCKDVYMLFGGESPSQYNEVDDENMFFKNFVFFNQSINRLGFITESIAILSGIS